MQLKSEIAQNRRYSKNRMQLFQAAGLARGFVMGASWPYSMGEGALTSKLVKMPTFPGSSSCFGAQWPGSAFGGQRVASLPGPWQPLIFRVGSISIVLIRHCSLSPHPHLSPLPAAFWPPRQPSRNHNLWMLLYFISFLLIVSFFVLNMFVGVVVENFHKCRQHQEAEEARRREEKRLRRLEKKRRSKAIYMSGR